jgi:hypothetical protein
MFRAWESLTFKVKADIKLSRAARRMYSFCVKLRQKLD